MAVSVKTFFKHLSHFMTGKALSLVLGLITFPILTRGLSKEDYGILGLVTTTMLLMVAISKAGISNGMIRYYKQYSHFEQKKIQFVSTVFIRGVMLSGVVSIFYFLACPQIIKFVDIDESYLASFLIMVVYLFFRPINIIIFNLMRVKEKTILINGFVLLERILTICIGLFLLFIVFHKIIGYFIGQIIATSIVSLILFSWFFSNYKIHRKEISWSLTKELMKFGTPLLLTELSYLLLSYADRYLILAIHGEQTLGLYSVGYNLAMYVSDLLTFSMSFAVIPLYVSVYETQGKQKTEEFLSKSLYYLLIAVIPICFGYYAVCEDMFVFLASKKYAQAAEFSPIIITGTIFLGLNNIFNAGLYLKKKSATILIIMLMAVTVNIILNIILIPEYSVNGAAIATLAACLMSSLLTNILSRKYIRIKLNFKLLYYFFLSAAMMILLIQIDIETIWVSLFVKVLIGMSLILSVVIMSEPDVRINISQFVKKYIDK